MFGVVVIINVNVVVIVAVTSPDAAAADVGIVFDHALNVVVGNSVISVDVVMAACCLLSYIRIREPRVRAPRINKLSVIGSVTSL